MKLLSQFRLSFILLVIFWEESFAAPLSKDRDDETEMKKIEELKLRDLKKIEEAPDGIVSIYP